MTVSNPFAAPTSSAGIKFAPIEGALLIIEPSSIETGIDTVHGVTDAVKATVTVVDGDLAGTVYADTLIFPKVLRSQIAPSVGKAPVLGRLGKGATKPGKAAPWMLMEASPEDVEAAVKVFTDRMKPSATDAVAPF